MPNITRLPALPLIVNDPYFSIWCAADALTDADTTHWAGERKRIIGQATVDGQPYRFLGLGDAEPMTTSAMTVTPAMTKAEFTAGGVRLVLRFATPLLLDEPDVLSVPVTYVDFLIESDDGEEHAVALSLKIADDICYDGAQRPEMMGDAYASGGLNIAYTGQKRQKLLCHSGDHITIDWGYLYLASAGAVALEEDGLVARFSANVSKAGMATFGVLVGYDDVASIDYFGVPTRAWYQRNGKTFVEALMEFAGRHDELIDRMAVLDSAILREARARGGEDYALITSAAYRHAIAAHKLIADEKGQMIWLSKENDSNGCIGTVDISYPSSPLFLKYNPEFVRAMCRPVLRFASMPVWSFDFAPHDVGRYPHATGQVYALKNRCGIGDFDVYPPIYQYPATEDLFDLKYQMPVEECGNMLIMLYAAAYFDGNFELISEYMDLLRTWVEYLLKYGEDPGEQLCTDDFAGHLARNINLSAKAVVGVACFGKMLIHTGDQEKGEMYLEKARELAKSWLCRADAGDHTYLTFAGEGWSMKYNLVWDRLLGLDLLPESFYEAELKSYLPRMNRFGLPLDSRATYTKSDWILWTAAMTEDEAVFAKFVQPIAEYLRKSATRVPFSDWYDTVSGNYVHFIARSVQAGVFMPLL